MLLVRRRRAFTGHVKLIPSFSPKPIMNALWILALLILISGVFSLAEMALASARRARLTQLAEAGDSGAATALAIKDHPSRLLAASQTGITAAALLMGIYGESALSASIEAVIGANVPALADWQSTIAFVITIVIVTAVSIILGEIVPKRIALANPEKVAAFCAPSMSLFIRLLSPGDQLPVLCRGPGTCLAADSGCTGGDQHGRHPRVCG